MLNGDDYSVLYDVEQHLFGYTPPGIEAAIAHAVVASRYALRAAYCDEFYGVLRIAIIRSNLPLDYRKRVALSSLNDPRVQERHKEEIRRYGGPGWFDPPAALPEPGASPPASTPG